MPYNHLIVAATKLEIQHLNHFKPLVHKSNAEYLELNENVKCLVTGIGQYNTIRILTEHILYYGKPTSILNIGIAGTFINSQQLTTLVKIRKDIAYDQKVEQNKKILSWQEAGIPEPKSNIFEPETPHYYNSVHLNEAVGLTSDTISDNQSRIRQLIQKHNPATESMEGAAVFYMAKQYNIPSMQIRAISNYVGEKDKSLWKIKESIVELNRFVNENLFQNLKDE